MTVLVFWIGFYYVLLGVLIAALLVALIVGYELLRRQFNRVVQSNDQAQKALKVHEQLAELNRTVQSTAQAGQKELGKLWRQTEQSLAGHLDRANDINGQLRRSLGAIGEASERIIKVSTQLGDLNEALRLPPPGVADGGGIWLADLLGQILPPQHYQLAAAVGPGRPIDAVIQLGNHLIGIDSSFPAAKVAAPTPAADGGDGWVRRHIDRVAAECILPERGTVDFALLYLPVENIYYDLIIRGSNQPDSLCNYALSRRVIPVSPNTLYAYLYTIVLGLRGMQFEQEARKIMARLGQLRGSLEQFQEAFRVIGTHLNHAAGKYDQAGRQLARLTESFADALPPPLDAADAPAAALVAGRAAERAAERPAERPAERAAERAADKPAEQSLIAEPGDALPAPDLPAVEPFAVPPPPLAVPVGQAAAPAPPPRTPSPPGMAAPGPSLVPTPPTAPPGTTQPPASPPPAPERLSRHWRRRRR